MGVFGDERAQAIQVGAVLIFAILIIFLSTYQAFVVPNQNEEIEFNHNQEAQQQMTDLRSNIILMPGSSSTRAAAVDLGVRYPSRALFVNPGPASGSLRTVGTEDPAFNLTLDNAEAVESERETGDFWNGTAVTYNTGAIQFRPGYNLYQNAPRTMYEHSVLYNNFTREGVTQAVTDQTLIDGNQITLIAINGSMSESRVGAVSMDFDPISTRSRTVEVNNTGDPITLSLVTGMSRDEWTNSTLDEEMVENGGYVQSVDVSSGGPDGFNVLEITLEPDERYQLELAKVGVGTGATETNSAYLTDIDGNDTSTEIGTTQQFTVEVRDKFNVPQSGVKVTGTPEGGSFTGSNNKTSGSDGQATFRYEAKDPGTHRINFTIEPGYTPDGSHIATTPQNITMTVTVPEEQTGGGGGGGAYNVTWQNPSVGNSAVTETAEDGVYDYDATETSELDLTMETLSPTDGAPVDFSVSDKQKGLVSPVESTTTDSESTTTFDPRQTGEVNVYTASGGSGDVLTLNVTDIESGQLDIDPDQANKASVHNWSFQDVPFEGEVDNITATYPAGASFDGLNQNDITVFITRPGDSDPTEITVNSDSYSGSGATFDLSGNPEVDGTSWVEIDGLENPDIGTYDATLTFRGPDDIYAVTKTFTIGEFNVTIDSVTDPVQEGDDVTVDYTIQNTGDKQDTQDIVFTVDDDSGTQIYSDTESGVTLNSGGTDTGSFTYTTQNGDTPEITVDVASDNDNATETVTVNDSPFFAVTLDNVNNSVTTGDDVVVDYTIENTGGIQDTQDIEFRVDGNLEATNSSVSLGGGSATSGQFTYTTNSSDTPQITVNVSSNNDNATETVTVNDSPFFEVNITGTNSPVDEGETLTVDVNVTNTGDVADTQILNLTDTGFDDTERDTIEVSLSPGQSNTSIALNWSTSNGDAGTGNVTVYSDNDSATAQVEVTSSTANQVQYVGGSGSAEGLDKGVVEFDLENTGTSTASITGIIVNSTTDPNADKVDNGGDNEFEGAGGSADVNSITIGATDRTTLGTVADISASDTETFTLREFRKSQNNNTVSMNNDNVTVTLYFEDGSDLTITFEATEGGGGGGGPPSLQGPRLLPRSEQSLPHS